ncbi:MAG: NAD(P)/FAD-dependent oxidoreductase [Ignavibacterium sp.]|jgi:pyruvate/2-oxoglutarate dehydrogenase complex dihydrolipoamide dehydrogenase (E3) component|nr:NAD(P)/FAD-dependent oxidoreductase [Ignavibacterium sp.]
MEKYQIVIADNGEPALVCTLSARSTYSDKSIAIIKTDKRNTIIEEILTPVTGTFNNMFNIFYDDIASRDKNKIVLTSGRIIEFEKLVLASGSRAIEPPIEGINKSGVILINKDVELIRKTKKEAVCAENIVVYGGGYIGVELCDELLRLGKRVTIIEKSTRLMPSSFDAEISYKIKEVIENLGGRVILDSKIRQVIGLDSVTGVKLNSDVVVDCDFLMICAGSRPNVDMAEKLGIIYDKDRGILIDEYFRTSDKNIYAVGDCAAKHDFFASDLSNVLTYSSKLEEAKLLGANLYSIIFNRGKMISYLSEKTDIKSKILNELKNLEITDASETYLHLSKL